MRRWRHRLIGIALAALLVSSIEPYLVVVRAAITVVTSEAAGSSDGTTVATPDVDTTGASLVGACVASYEGATAPTLVDDQSNTYACGTPETSSGNARVQFCFDASPNVGPGHSLSINHASSFPSIAMIALAGTHATPFDQENGDATGSDGTTFQGGPVTPGEDNEIVIGCGSGFNSITGVDSPFTLLRNVGFVAGQHFPIALARDIQTTATTRDPTWTYTAATSRSATTATFKQSAGGGGGSTCKGGLLMLGAGKC